jgi:hypothetical protein
MRMNFRHGGTVGMLAAAFGLLGPVAAQAGQIPGTSVPTCAGACDLKAPAAHLSGIDGTSIILTSMITRSSGSNGYGQGRLGLPGERDRVLQQSDRCDRCGWWDGRWRCGDFDDHGHYGRYHHHHHRGDFDDYGYGHYRHNHHYRHHDHHGYRYGDFDDYGHYGHHHYR